MQVINNNALFTQVSAEESAIASGGAGAEAATYIMAAFFAFNNAATLTANQAVAVLTTIL